jgi:hypothetical protein
MHQMRMQLQKPKQGTFWRSEATGAPGQNTANLTHK